MRTIDSTIRIRDIAGMVLVRLGIRRGAYAVKPGVYSLNNPDALSPVFVSANYKLSFDILRNALKGIGCRILVLDTRGINVWCAAGKGTFGTAELISRLNETELAKQINHKKIILPQLGAPGVEAHIVRKRTGFSIIYGPVEARDIAEFIQNGMDKTPGMRTKKFGIRDRLVLTPVELVHSWKVLLLLAASGLLFTFFSAGPAEITFSSAVLPGILGIISGGLLTPFLLPWIPFRAFALKGAVVGAASALLWFFSVNPPTDAAVFNGGLLIAASSFIAMNFTGASTYTSLSGVKKEMRYAVPLQLLTAAGAAIGGILISILKGAAL